MSSETLHIQAADGHCAAYLATPSTPGTYPAVILYMDALGFRPWLQQMADRLASSGYRVLVPDLLYRLGPAHASTVADILKPENRPLLMERVSSLTPERTLEDTACFLAHLDQQPAPKKHSSIGVTGYCMGGAMAVRAAAAFPDRIAAAASFHGGRLVTEATDSPHRLLSRVHAELYFGHADQDPSMTPEQIRTLDAALVSSGRRYQSEIYAGARHGFVMIDHPAYDAKAEAQHWNRLTALLSRTLN